MVPHPQDLTANKKEKPKQQQQNQMVWTVSLGNWLNRASWSRSLLPRASCLLLFWIIPVLTHCPGLHAARPSSSPPSWTRVSLLSSPPPLFRCHSGFDSCSTWSDVQRCPHPRSYLWGLISTQSQGFMAPIISNLMPFPNTVLYAQQMPCSFFPWKLLSAYWPDNFLLTPKD